jgi:uncharacterized membrane protein YhfC
MKRLERYAAALALAVIVGLVGASAFNPDNGFLIHSESLWRIFGLTFEIGAAILLLAVILAISVGVFRSLRSRTA